MELILATHSGIKRWQDGRIVDGGLAEQQVTAVIAREGVLLAGTRDGVWRSDNGRDWLAAGDGLTQRHVRWMAFHPDVSDFELVGTEPAALFVSRDGGASWREAPEVAALRDRLGWWLPYSPQAGCVRGFAFHGRRGYAAVEVGGLLRSDDAGATWQLAPGSDGLPRFGRPAPGRIHPDVHSVTVHPGSAGQVYAPTGGGFYVSQDGGASWRGVALEAFAYVRAVWVDPQDPRRMVLGPADGPDRHGRIAVTRDAGESWETVTAVWPGDMVERFTQAGEALFAVLSSGALLRSDRNGRSWQPVEGVAGVTCATMMHV